MLKGKPHGLCNFDTARLSLKVSSPSIRYLSLSLTVPHCYVTVRTQREQCLNKEDEGK
jgi:hypothetical protein